MNIENNKLIIRLDVCESNIKLKYIIPLSSIILLVVNKVNKKAFHISLIQRGHGDKLCRIEL